jgi:hypothetical protein
MALRDVFVSPQAREELAGALADAFPRREALIDLVGVHLGQTEPGGRDLAEMARHVVEDHVAQSTVRVLLAAARVVNANNEGLVAFEATHTRRYFDSAGEGDVAGVRRMDLLRELVSRRRDAAVAVARAFDAAFDRRESLPRWFQESEIHTKTLCSALLGLVAEQDAPSERPLQRFVSELLSMPGDEALRRDVRTWARELGKRLGAGSAEGVGRAASTEPPGRYVMIRVARTQMGDSYLVAVWVFFEEAGGQPREVWRHEIRDTEELRSALRMQLKDPKSKLALALSRDPPVPPGKITFEFILPRNLLDLDVDHWNIGARDLSVGKFHRVVVRSYERIYEVADRGWRSKWESWRGESRQPGVVHRFDPGRDAVDEGFRLALAEDNVIGLLCLGPPANDRDDAVMEVVELGVPIALWPRRASPQGAEELERLAKLVEDVSHDPRDALLLARKKAAGDGDVRSHITLLWDDPRRKPPDIEDLHDPTFGE